MKNNTKLFSRFIRNTSSVMILQVIEVVMAFVIMPFMINYLDKGEYGVWLVVNSLYLFLLVMQLGISIAAQRYMSEAIGKNNLIRLNQITSNIYYIYLASAALVVAIAIVLSNVSTLFVSVQYSDLFGVLLLIIGIKTAVCMPSNAFLSLLLVNHRFDIQARIDIFIILVRSFMVMSALLLHADVVLIALIILCVDIIGALIVIFITKKVISDIVIQKSDVSKKILIDLLRFAFFSSINRLGESLRNTSHNFLVSRVIGASSVVNINVPFTLIYNAVKMINVVFSVFVPMLTQLHDSRNYTKFNSMYRISIDVIFFITTLTSLGLAFLGIEFVELWIGSNMGITSNIMMAFICYLLFYSSNVPVYIIFSIYHKQKALALITLFEAVIVFLSGWILISLYGFDGVVWGLAVPVILFRGVIIPNLSRRIAIDVTGSNIILYRTVIFTLLLVLIGGENWGSVINIEGWWQFVLYTVLIIILYSLLFYNFIATRDSKKVVSGYIKRYIS